MGSLRVAVKQGGIKNRTFLTENRLRNIFLPNSAANSELNMPKILGEIKWHLFLSKKDGESYVCVSFFLFLYLFFFNFNSNTNLFTHLGCITSKHIFLFLRGSQKSCGFFSFSERACLVMAKKNKRELGRNSIYTEQISFDSPMKFTVTAHHQKGGSFRDTIFYLTSDKHAWIQE